MPKKFTKRKQNPDLQQTQLYDKVTKLQSQMIADLQYLNKKRNDKFDCLHCYQQLSISQQNYDSNINYYDQYWKTFLINTICIKRYYDYKQWIQKINKKINHVQKTYMKRKKLMQPIQSKRTKRSQEHNQNNSSISCDICGKLYKDQSSLEIHKNIKHHTHQHNQHNQQIKFQAKIQQLNHQFYIDHSQSEKNYYLQD